MLHGAYFRDHTIPFGTEVDKAVGGCVLVLLKLTLRPVSGRSPPFDIGKPRAATTAWRGFKVTSSHGRMETVTVKDDNGTNVFAEINLKFDVIACLVSLQPFHLFAAFWADVWRRISKLGIFTCLSFGE